MSKIPQEYFYKVRKYFNGDDKKTWDWFQNLHPNFGMLSPLNMIKLGKQEKVIQFINKEMLI
jgi:hypothetical protein